MVMMRTLADEKININNRRIHYKVVSSTDSPENLPFLLCIQGGPGFSSLSVENAVAEIAKHAKNAKMTMPNLIFFDPVGCGQSDKADDIEAEYSLDNYSEIAAQVVEYVKQKFSPNKTMDLRIFGGSFGGVAVMHLPFHRQQWLDEGSDIRLRQIIAYVTPNGAGGREYSRNFVDVNFKNHPEYNEIRINLDKLLDGNIKDNQEYLRFVFGLAPLYSDKMARVKNGFIGRMLMNHTQGTIRVLRVFDKILNIFGNHSLSLMIEALTGCSLDVLNQFFKTQMNGFDMTKLVSDNHDLYAKLPICLVACDQDHMVDWHTSANVSKLLPDTCASIIVKGKHQQAREKGSKEFFDNVFLGLVCGGSVPMDELNKTLVAEHTVTDSFNHMLAELNSPIKTPESTERTLSVLSRASGEKPAVIVEPPQIDLSVAVAKVKEEAVVEGAKLVLSNAMRL